MDKIIIFNDKKIRRIWNEGEWFFVLEDVIAALTESKDPKQYIQKMKQRDELLNEGWVQFVRTLSIGTKGGNQSANCANKQGLFRIIQSIPSKRAEPFKLWLAKVGSDRIDEIENPELAQERMKILYEQKGYSKAWIDKRLRGIAVRQNLTDEWKGRGVGENVEYAILTNEISMATFGKTIQEYRELKGIDRENLRDHMDELELIFGMLGEKVATEITVSKDVEGFHECADAARQGGNVAGNARKEAERKIGRSVVSEGNFLSKDEVEKKKKRKLEVVNEK